MKKTMIFAGLIAVLFIGQLAMPVLVKADASGDMNNDGLINQNDVQILAQQISGQETPDVANGDMDGDGIIAPSDIVALKLKVAHQVPDQNPAPVPPAQTPGDANGDGQVDYKDLGVLKEIVAGQVPSDGSADLDGDGIIGPSDVAAMKLLLAHQSGGSSTSTLSAPATTASESITPEISADQTAVTSTTSAPVYQLPSNPLCQGITGDLNGDGLINEADLTVSKAIVAGQEPFTPCADFDQDGVVGPSDVSALKHVIYADIPQNNIVQTPAPLAAIQSATNDCTYGDANGDGQIDFKDADLVKEMIAGIIPSATSGDLDGDGVVAPSDIALLKLKIAHQNGSNAVTPAEKGNCNAPKAVEPASDSTPSSSVELRNSDTSCSAVTYGDWSDAVNGMQTREITSSFPDGCSLTDAQKADEQRTEPVVIEPVVNQTILGEKTYADGSLLRALNDAKVYVIQNGMKLHIKSLQDLSAKYFGQTIYNVSPEVLAAYPTIE